MAMTEADAKTKWCPFVRVQLLQPDGFENQPVNRETRDINCIAAQCMAWRKAMADGSGFCGLAGKP